MMPPNVLSEKGERAARNGPRSAHVVFRQDAHYVPGARAAGAQPRVDGRAGPGVEAACQAGGAPPHAGAPTQEWSRGPELNTVSAVEPATEPTGLLEVKAMKCLNISASGTAAGPERLCSYWGTGRSSASVGDAP
jgi:hypothetical protein